MEEESKAKLLRAIRWIILIVLIMVGIFLLISISQEVTHIMLTINIDGNATPELVNKILDIIDEQKVQTTFFVPGAWAEQNPELTQIIATNNEVACYTYSETRIAPLSNESLEKEIVGCKEILQNITNKTITGFRAPARDLSGKALLLVAKHYEYDSSTFRRYEWFWEAYPPILLPIPTSSILLLPADDRFAASTLHLGDAYYWFLRRARQKELVLSFSTKQLAEGTLDFEYLLAYYKEKGVLITSIQTALDSADETDAKLIE